MRQFYYLALAAFFSLFDLAMLKLMPEAWLLDLSGQESSANFQRKKYKFIYYFWPLLLINFFLIAKIPGSLSPSFKLIKIIYSNFLILIGLVDAFYYIIPDQFTLVIASLGFFQGLKTESWKFLLASALGFFLLLIIFTLLMNRITKKETFGMGDIKLLSAIALNYGFINTVSILNRAVLLALSYFIIKLLIKNKSWTEPLPFGPFIIMALLFKSLI